MGSFLPLGLLYLYAASYVIKIKKNRLKTLSVSTEERRNISTEELQIVYLTKYA